VADQPWTKRWGFYLGVTLLLALPVALAYFYLGGLLSQSARQRHKIQLRAQLNVMQEQLYDTKWDALADTFDDTLHLGRYDEAQLLRDTLMTYVYPDGRSFVEGIAIVNPDGSLRPSRLAAVIDDEGRPLGRARLAELKKAEPWLEEPWLPSYGFVIRAFADNPELDNWLSPFIQAPGRLVLVAASAQRNAEGRVACAVVLQHSIKSLWRDLQAPERGELDLWLMDRRGTLGLATSELAAESAAAFKASGQLAKLLAGGARAADEGRLGISGEMKQTLRAEPSRLNYRSLAGDMLLGAAVRESALGAQAAAMLRYLGIISLWALLILAAAGAIYTVASLREEARMVEKATLRRYAGTVSHRVRNDLVTVMGNLELISTGRLSDPERIKETLKGPVNEALADIQATVEELERLSRGEADLTKGGQLGLETMYESTEDVKGGKRQHELDSDSGG
jgi:signal transduction histidine kinase